MGSPEQAHAVERRVLVNHRHALLVHDRVLGERRRAHEVIQRLALIRLHAPSVQEEEVQHTQYAGVPTLRGDATDRTDAAVRALRDAAGPRAAVARRDVYNRQDPLPYQRPPLYEKRGLLSAFMMPAPVHVRTDVHRLMRGRWQYLQSPQYAWLSRTKLAKSTKVLLWSTHDVVPLTIGYNRNWERLSFPHLVARDAVVPGLDAGHALAHALHDAGGLVPQHTRELPLSVQPLQRILHPPHCTHRSQ